MPTVFTKDGFRFFFYSNDHRPIHVHARKGDGEAVFNSRGGNRAPGVRGPQGAGAPTCRGLGKRAPHPYNPEVE
ncbi:MAG: DUF4160 domain-containing protein [Acidobacteriota bacterium]